MGDTADVIDTAQDTGVDPAEEETAPGETDEGGTEEERPAPQEEETAAPEAAAEGGGGRVSIELAGLPVGGGEVLDVDGTWCQVLFWRSVPAGVWLDIEAVQVVGDHGGTLLDPGCAGAPPCVGARVSTDEPSGCAVTIRPPSPDIAFVEVQLNGTLSCPDQASCDAIGATDGSRTKILNPTGGVTSEDPSTADADTTGGAGGSPDGEPDNATDTDSEDDGSDVATTGNG